MQLACTLCRCRRLPLHARGARASAITSSVLLMACTLCHCQRLPPHARGTPSHGPGPGPSQWALPRQIPQTVQLVAAVCARSTAWGMLTMCMQAELQTVFAVLKQCLHCFGMQTVQTVFAVRCRQCLQSVFHTVLQHCKHYLQTHTVVKLQKSIAQHCKTAQTCKQCDAIRAATSKAAEHCIL